MSLLSLEALVVASVVVVAEVELFVELSSLLVFVTSAGSESKLWSRLQLP